MKLKAESPAALVLRPCAAARRSDASADCKPGSTKGFYAVSDVDHWIYSYTLALVFFTMDNGDQPFIDNWPVISTMAKQVRTKKRNLAG